MVKSRIALIKGESNQLSTISFQQKKEYTKLIDDKTRVRTAVAKNRSGEVKEMKKALLCDTLSATAMTHQRKTGLH